mgnify:CR=1 FL=1
MKTAADRITEAQASFEAGFLSMAAKKRALDQLNRAYDAIREAAHGAQIDHANGNPALNSVGENRFSFFRENDLPFGLHQVRDRHVEIIEKWAGLGQTVREMIALREAIKEAEIAPAPAKPEIEQKAEAVRKAVIDEIEKRKAQFVEGLEVARMFGGLPVAVNAHLVRGHKGAIFLRHFFYLRGKLTPLNMIIAIAEAYEAEKEAAH